MSINNDYLNINDILDSSQIKNKSICSLSSLNDLIIENNEEILLLIIKNQMESIEEYSNWLEILLKILKNEKFEYVNPIQNGLYRIYNDIKDNILLKQTYIQSMIKKEYLIEEYTLLMNKKQNILYINNSEKMKIIEKKLDLIAIIEKLSIEIGFLLEKEEEIEEALQLNKSNSIDEVILYKKIEIEKMKKEVKELKQKILIRYSIKNEKDNETIKGNNDFNNLNNLKTIIYRKGEENNKISKSPIGYKKSNNKIDDKRVFGMFSCMNSSSMNDNEMTMYFNKTK